MKVVGKKAELVERILDLTTAREADALHLFDLAAESLHLMAIPAGLLTKLLCVPAHSLDFPEVPQCVLVYIKEELEFVFVF